MRPLWITERFPPQKGGVASAAGRQVGLLAASAESLDVLQLSGDVAPGHVEPETGDGFTVHRLGRAPRDEESHRLLFQVAVELGRAGRHTHVHGFYAVHSGYVATLVGRALGRPSLVSLRGNDVDLAMFQGNRQPLLRQALETADAVLPVSHELADSVRLLCGRDRMVRVVHNGVDTAAFAPGPVPAAALEEIGDAPRPWIGFSGELRFKKGLTLLLALAERMADAGAGTLFAIGGGRGDEREGLVRWRVRRPAASSRLRELPYRRDRERLAGLYRAMDLVVFPSLWDGTPNALLEAMACGRPVLAAAVGGIRDVVEPDRSGLLLPLTGLDGFPGAALEAAALPEARRAELGRGARERVEAAFSLDHEREALLGAYAGLSGDA